MYQKKVRSSDDFDRQRNNNIKNLKLATEEQVHELTNSMYETWLDMQDLVHSIQNLSAKMEQIDSWLKMEEEPERS